MSKRIIEEKKSNPWQSIFVIAIIAIVAAIAVMVSNNKGLEKSSIKELSYQEFIEKIKDDEYTVALITRNGCNHCISYKPSVNVVAKKYNLTVYELNIQKLSSEEFTYIHDNINAFKNVYNQSDGSLIIQTPGTVLYKNGVEVDSLLGDRGEDGFTNFLVRNGVVN